MGSGEGAVVFVKKMFAIQVIYPLSISMAMISQRHNSSIKTHYFIGHRELNNLLSKLNYTLPSGTCLACSFLTRGAHIKGNS